MDLMRLIISLAFKSKPSSEGLKAAKAIVSFSTVLNGFISARASLRKTAVLLKNFRFISSVSKYEQEQTR